MPPVACRVRLSSQAHCTRKASNKRAAMICGLPKRSRVKNVFIQRRVFYHVGAPLRKLMQDPALPESPPPPLPHGSPSHFLSNIFLGQDGLLRAGWRFLLYLVIG